jgi:anti-sigma regulatory factor (Ser/Thr protein kinase)
MVLAHFSLPPSPSSARRAREALRRHLDEWGEDEARDAALLLVSELVTNAVLHARSEVTVHLDVTPERLRVRVDDASPEPPVRRGGRADLPGGRGLQLLDALAKGWGVLSGGSGKTVWFEIDAHPA